MSRFLALFLSPLVAAALVYWLGFYALLGCFALVLGTFVLSTAGPKSAEVPVDDGAHRHRALRRRGAHMARS